MLRVFDLVSKPRNMLLSKMLRKKLSPVPCYMEKLLLQVVPCNITFTGHVTVCVRGRGRGGGGTKGGQMQLTTLPFPLVHCWRRGLVVRALDVQPGDPGFKSFSLPLAGFVFCSPDLNSTMLCK